MSPLRQAQSEVSYERWWLIAYLDKNFCTESFMIPLKMYILFKSTVVLACMVSRHGRQYIFQEYNIWLKI